MGKTVFAVLAACAVMFGCAFTPEGLKSNPDNKRASQVSVPYQLAFKRITEAQRECASTMLLPLGQFINEAHLYPDLKMGTLTLGSSGVGTQITQHVEVNWASDTTAQIIVFSVVKPQMHLHRFTRWASGNSSCDF